MADFISTSPDFSYEPLIPKVEVVSWIPENIDNKTKNILIDTKNKTAVILVSAEAKQQSKELNDELKKQFIEKLKQLPDYDWSKVKEAIEKWTIEIKKIPNRNWYAIYESKVWNLVYLTYSDWKSYTNIDKYRTKEMLSDIFEAGYIRQWYWKIEQDISTWLRMLYKKDWTEVPIFSDEYSIATLNAINTMWDFVDYIDEESKKRERK